MEKPIVALIYDFDKTLCDQDMQNYSLIPNLDMTPDQFWGEIGEFTKQENMEGILSYLYYMVKKSKEKGRPITKDYLQTLGSNVNFYQGVLSWFDRINKFGEENGVVIEHYVISSGITDIIKSTKIANKFKNVFACDFYYDENGEAVWPKIAINFTLKTQYLYKINKGIDDAADSTLVNQKYNKKRIPFKNMIYIGDGLTDVPCMIMLKKEGGRSIGLYTEHNKANVQRFLVEDRVSYVCPAVYNEHSYLDKTVKLIIKSIALANELQQIKDDQLVVAEKALSKGE